MFVDIAGFTALMGRDEKRALEIIHISKEIQRPLVEKYNGKWLKEMGDGVMCQFATASDAVACALEIQTSPTKPPDLNLKVGIHLGEITEEKGDIYGDGVNVASRIESIGKPGAILFSKKVRDEIKNQDQFKLVSLGVYDFVNVDEPIEIFALANEGLVVPKRNEIRGKLKKKKALSPVAIAVLALVIISSVFIYRFVPKEASIEKALTDNSIVEKSIAVLPFENLNNDPSIDYFPQGVSDEIRSQLASLKDLKVISRSSSIFFKDKVLPMEELRNTLKVNYILGGRMWINKDSFRLRVFLTQTDTDREVWSSEPMEGSIDKVIETQELIAQQVASQLGISSSGKVTRFGSINEVAPPIYNLWLKAWNDHEKYTQTDFKSAFETGSEILKRDSAFSLGYYLLGDYYLMNAVWFGGISIAEGRTNAIRYFNQGLKLDPNNALCYVGLGNAKLFFEYDYEYAIEAFNKASDLGEPRANLALSMANFYTGNFIKAEEHLNRFSELDPLSVFTDFFKGRILFLEGKDNEAFPILKRGIDKYKIADYYHSLGKVYLNSNRYKEAIEILTRGIKETGQNIPAMLGDLAIAYYKTGNTTAYQQIINDLMQRVKTNATGSPAFYLGQIYAGIDQTADALTWLEKAYELRETELVWLKIEPQFKKLANQNRYIKLLANVGLMI
jgi:TolB-like protein/tetratricopeptide (TPR) repeat protein